MGTEARSGFSMGKVGCLGTVLLGVALFSGTMIGTAGGAMFPSIAMRPAALVCDGTVELESHSYSYRPGQRGVTRSFFCVDDAGERVAITGKTMAATCLYYSVWVFLVLVVMLLVFRVPRARNARAQTAPMGGSRAARPDASRDGSRDPSRDASAPRHSPARAPALQPTSRNAEAARLLGLFNERLRTSSDYVRHSDANAQVRAVGQDAPSLQSIEERLQQLESLRERRLISDDEYSAKRAEILSSL